MGEGHEQEVAAAGVVGGGRAEAALDHAHDRFDLPTLTVALVVEVGLHQPAVKPFGRLGCRSAMLRRNERSDAVLVATAPMVRLAVVAGSRFRATVGAVTNTFRGDLLVLLLHKHISTIHHKFSVFYRAFLTPFSGLLFF